MKILYSLWDEAKIEHWSIFIALNLYIRKESGKLKWKEKEVERKRTNPKLKEEVIKINYG